jgi:transcriptional regulator with XRE-family HTH domain
VLTISVSDQNHREIIGSRLKSLRLKKKEAMKLNKEGLLTMEKIANNLGISRATYADWELGRRSPRGKKLLDLAKFYSTTVDYIIGKTEDDSPRKSTDIILNDNLPLTINGVPVRLDEEQKREFSDFLRKLTSE